MGSLIPNSQIAEMTGALMDHFTTFKRQLVVYKAPLQTVDASQGYYPGYEQPTADFTQQTGVYYAVKVSPSVKPGVIGVEGTNSVIRTSQIRIKVLPETMNFISQGATECLLFDGLRYNTISKPIPNNYLGLQFYYYDLQQTD